MAPGDPVPDRTWQVRLPALLALVPIVGAVFLVGAEVEVSRPVWAGLAFLSVLMIFVQLAAFVQLAGRRNGPAAFIAVEKARQFRVRVRPIAAWMLVPFGVYTCLQLMHPGYWDGADLVDVLMRAAYVVLAGAAVLPALAALLRPFRVVLTPEGVRTGLAARVTPWDAAVVRPAGLVRWPDVHPTFLADAILYYRTHPEFRSEIGTPAEHRRLYAALVAARIPA
ncbi:hypothetical protein [Hamadaea tsunoensis]|uniref:hypothetical protein n=1 Tax=Hamadaea tsunoensis TaxID=53368 RepID=UPI000404D2E2|nr:hypothetical protein [Hamadaea tsunoensis]